MKVVCRTVGPLQANAYLLVDETSREAVLVDPGAEPDTLFEALRSEAATLTAIWLTHAHFDHVGALAAVAERHPVPVYLNDAERPLLDRAAASAALWGLDLRQPDVATTHVGDGATLTVGRHRAVCLFTPGHAPGHLAFHLPEVELVLAGDTLFRGSIGRTDLPGGNFDTLLTSIRTKLLVLPETTAVLPGHGPDTTVAAEARTNPFLGAFRV